MAQRIGLYIAVETGGDPVAAGPDIAALINAGWRYLNTANLTYGQIVDPPSGPSTTAVTVWVFEDNTADAIAEDDATSLGLLGIFGAS